jgi:hypothetical protein
MMEEKKTEKRKKKERVTSPDPVQFWFTKPA